MQLFATDENNCLISARQARKHQDYHCLECRGIVRRRGGVHRTLHFFHLNSSATCRQNGKSMTHLQAQHHIRAVLPPEECQLEKHFPSIERIADAVWEAKKIIFEIQCSPISAEEVLQRNSDYGTLGYQVIWILHENQFNQWKQSSAEMALVSSPHYYTNIDEEGSGFIYDQLILFWNGLRKLRLEKHPIDISSPSAMQKKDSLVCPKVILERLQTWPLYFDGDLCKVALSEGNESFVKALEMEKSLYPPVQNLWARARYWIARPYKIFFQILLERACK